MEVKKLYISGGSPTIETAGSILQSFEKGATEIDMRAIGASSVNQMVKAIATARSIYKLKGEFDITCQPYYDTVKIEGKDKTVVVMRVTLTKEGGVQNVDGN